eukprot:GABV01000873.1.p1 GENE.GABV01000873.1~~GABV01000873.1.p1  ORF type:complete len:228 (-),score=47.37 GABV01000873.1:305-988(-)
MEPGATSRELVRLLACVLEALCREKGSTASNRHPNKALTKFSACELPPISVFDYLERISLFGGASDECFILGLIYIDRLIQAHRLTVSFVNIHRLVVTSIMIAAKFFDDFFFNNQHWAQVAGVACTELNALEIELLFLLGCDLQVSPDEFFMYRKNLLTHAKQFGCECPLRSDSTASSPSMPTAFLLPPVQFLRSMQPYKAILAHLHRWKTQRALLHALLLRHQPGA